MAVLRCVAGVVVLGIWGLSSALAAGPPPNLNLVPWPARLQAGTGEFKVSPDTRIIVDNNPELQAIGRTLSTRLHRASGWSLPVDAAGTKPAAHAIILTTAHADPGLGDEGYSLESSPTGVIIRAPHPAGVFYGVQTLRQLLPIEMEGKSPAVGVDWTVPAVRIWDTPRFPTRGLMLDSSRHIQSVSFIKRTLDLLAYHKLNRFHWHLTDDNGWRLEIKKYPKLTSVGAWRPEASGPYGGFFTQDQVREIVKYAADRYITVVPEIDMPAHITAALAAYPELACTPGPFTVKRIGEETIDVLCAGKESSYAFVRDVLTEVMDLFPSKVIHIGGDELPLERWRACPYCQSRITTEHLKDERALQSYFTNRVASFLQAHGRRLQGWNEILEGGTLPRNVEIQSWNSPTSVGDAARAGHDVLVSLTKWCYFDYSYGTTPLQKVYDFEPVPDDLDAADRVHVLGGQGNLWTEWRPTDASADDYIWPREIAIAETTWTPKPALNWDGFAQRLKDGHLMRLATMGLGDKGTDTKTAYARLTDHAGFVPGTRIGRWGRDGESETFHNEDWDITKALATAGVYTITMVYDEGADGIAIDRVSLLKDGIEVDSDSHDGWAGNVSHDNAFTVKLSAVDPSAVYTVRAHVRSDGGVESHGSVWVKGPAAG